MCTGNMPDPLGLFDGRTTSLPDPLNVHTPSPAQQAAIDAAKKASERQKAAPDDEKPAAALKIKRPSAAAKPRAKLGRLALRIDLQSPGGGDAGGPPTLGAE